MQHGCGLLRLRRCLHIHQVIPAGVQRTDLMITLEPMEAMQLQTRGGVHVINAELGAATAIQQHQRTPILFGIGALHLS